MDGSLMEECSLKLLASIVQSNDSNYQVAVDHVKSKLTNASIDSILTSQSGSFDILGILACASGIVFFFDLDLTL